MSNGLGNKLVEQQQRDQASEERFQEEVRKMMKTNLTPVKRVAWGFAGLMGLCFLVLFSYMAWTTPSDFPLIGRLAFVAGAIFGAVWTGIAVWILKKGGGIGHQTAHEFLLSYRKSRIVDQNTLHCFIE